MARIEALLGARAPEGAQDWDLEAAGPERFEALVEAYASGQWNDDERFALGAVLLSTLDDRLYTTNPVDADTLARFEQLMLRDVRILANRIDYWAMPDEPDPDNVFRVTPIARRIRAAAEAGAATP